MFWTLKTPLRCLFITLYEVWVSNDHTYIEEKFRRVRMNNQDKWTLSITKFSSFYDELHMR